MPRKRTIPKAVALAFVKQINAHDPEGLAELMAKDHAFTDSLGRTFRGRQEMRKGWMQYFELFSDYKITISDTFQKTGTVVLLGTAEGVHVDRNSVKATKWKVPAAWKVVVRNGLISEWQVFADNFETMKLINGD